ncbi:MAG: alpha-2-macroglobulin, partial [Anaerolineae bacterium]|nr:alpha-2-macroglobulin [Anaerolineae bacterium]
TVYALLALTDYMVTTGELKADYGYNLTINEATLTAGTVTKDNLDEPEVVEVPIAELLAYERNEVRIERTMGAGQSGDGKLYYSMHLRYFLPSDQVRAVNRGIIVARDYTLLDDPERPVASARVGDVIKVRLTIIAPSDLHYLVVEDPLPAGCEAVDTTLKTTSVAVERPQVTRLDEKASSWSWGWWWFAHAELRDEKVALFSTYLPRGTYEYAYLIRASVPGEFLLMPTTAYEMYFPETFGRSDGGRFIVLE